MKNPFRKHDERKRIVGFVGGYLVSQGSITLEQLDVALLHQVQMAQSGEKISLGQILLRLGYVTRSELERAMAKHQRDRAML